jgi:hypothetical protein
MALYQKRIEAVLKFWKKLIGLTNEQIGIKEKRSYVGVAQW